MASSILVVDDEEPIRESITDYLEMKGFSVASAKNGEEALKKLDSLKVDIVITDIMMPGIDGLEVTKKIRETNGIKVIVMTGFNADYSYKDAVETGASDFIFKPFKFEELSLRIQRVEHVITLQKKHDETLKKIQKLVITDDLTNLYNSRHFYNIIGNEIERHIRYARPLSLLMLDIDFFKDYNDTWGHMEGDNVLSTLGQIITSCLRTSDLAFRYGGEEFAVLLPETKLDEACVVGERIRERISEKVFTPRSNEKASITISLGATELGEKDNTESLIKRSDKALYQSKKTGKNKLTRISLSD